MMMMQSTEEERYKALTNRKLTVCMNITVRQSRQSGVARATCPD